MFLRLRVLRFLLVYVALWGDYIKILIMFEILSLMIIRIIVYYVSLDYFSLNYFFSVLIFLVCESRIGFILFIFYIRIESDVVKKLNLVQF